MATTAYQAVSARARRKGKETGEDKSAVPSILNTCIAYGADSPVVRRYWPHLYTGPAEEAAAE